MPAPHVLMLLSNAYRPDPRVRKEAMALLERGYQVTVLAWDRQAELPPEEHDQDVRIVRIQSAPSAYGAGPGQLLRLPRFWRAAIRLGQELKPQVVHCHDLDTLPAGWRLKKRLGIPLVYDAHEDYPALMSLYLPVWMTAGLSLLEGWLARRVDAILTASTVVADQFQRRGLEPVTPIPNVPELEPFQAVTPAQIQAARQSLNLAESDLAVAYIGGFSRNRELLPLIEAAKALPGVQVLLWGDGHQRQAVSDAASGTANVRYLGWLPAEQVPLMTCAADVIYYCLKRDYPGAVYNAPNTLANAMAAGRPLLANRVGDLGRMVLSTGCGLLIDPVSPPAIRQALQELADPVLRQRMGTAGKRTAEAGYNWCAVKERLLDVYEEVVPFAKNSRS